MRSLIACILPALMLFAPAASAQKPATSATQFYMDYRTAWGKATSIEALLPYLSKDGRADIEATPKDKRQMMFDMMKMMGNMTNVKVVKETKEADGYLLDLTAIGPDKKPMTGTVEIVMEGSAMKVKRETWKG